MAVSLDWKSTRLNSSHLVISYAVFCLKKKTKIGRNDLRKAVYAALAAAFAGSIGVAIVVSRFNLNEDIFEGWVMLFFFFFVVATTVFMIISRRKLKGQ